MPLHVVYFRNAHGDIALPPDSTMPTPPGYERYEANTLDEIDRLQREMEQAERRRSEQELERDETAFMEARRRIYDSLNARLQSSATSQYEKDFIRLYLKLREEKRAEYRRRFICDTAYFAAREFDKGRNDKLIESLDL